MNKYTNQYKYKYYTPFMNSVISNLFHETGIDFIKLNLTANHTQGLSREGSMEGIPEQEEKSGAPQEVRSYSAGCSGC